MPRHKVPRQSVGRIYFECSITSLNSDKKYSNIKKNCVKTIFRNILSHTGDETQLSSYYFLVFLFLSFSNSNGTVVAVVWRRRCRKKLLCATKKEKNECVVMVTRKMTSILSGEAREKDRPWENRLRVCGEAQTDANECRQYKIHMIHAPESCPLCLSSAFTLTSIFEPIRDLCHC